MLPFILSTLIGFVRGYGVREIISRAVIKRCGIDGFGPEGLQIVLNKTN